MTTKNCELLLRQGVAVWNEWRLAHPKDEVQLKGMDLSRLDLSRADLTGADLTGADLSGTELFQTALSDAVLNGADLRAAHLINASCRRTNFRSARFMDATISNTDCQGADFRGVLFERRGHLSSCDLKATKFEEVDLSECYLEKSNLSGARFARSGLRKANLDQTDLRDADFTGADLAGASLRRANLSGSILAKLTLFDCDFSGANLVKTHLQQSDLRNATFCDAVMEGAYLGGAWMEGTRFNRANLRGAHFDGANLTRAQLGGADLTGAIFERAQLTDAVVKDAILVEANLERAILVRTDFTGALLTGARIYGIAAWDLILGDDRAKSRDLVITPEGQPRVVVDQIDVAQFTYLLLHNPNIRRVINTIGRRGVLILGRFTPERKQVLDAIRDELRRHGLVPILFDFDRPVGLSVRETVMTLAGLSLFIIADLTNPSSIPLELGAVIPAFEIPLAPIILEGEKPFAMFADLYNQFRRERGGHVLGVLTYKSIDTLTSRLHEKITLPAIELANELSMRKAKPIDINSLE
jgi:uncharacterized protein YjbI with pentapeptide repeats